MKKRIALVLCLVMLTSLFAGCDVSIDSILSMLPGFSNSQPTEPTETLPTELPTELPSEPVDPWADYQCITIAEALALCEQFVATPSAERYYIRATVKSIDNDQYGQMTIEDATGSIMVYGTSNYNGSIRYDGMTEKPVAGDEVLLYGTLQNYKGNTKEVQNGWIIDFIAKNRPQQPVELPADGSELTIAEILALPVPNGVITSQHYIVKANVESILNVAYGQMKITDGVNSIGVYNSKNADGTVGYADMEDKPYKGDSVTLKCTVQNFNGTMEIKQAYILEFKHEEVVVDPADYTEMSIADAREIALGGKVKVTGVVAQITYATGRKPSGVMLVDETGSIYVYDVNIAGRVAVGNRITILAEKDYWILEDEKSGAEKFGYKGCNQLTNAVFVEGDNEIHDFDKSWIEATTVKEIVDTPVNVDISTKIFKVTALVKKVPGSNFVNYYFFDLDGETGAYTYTQCNGGDFEWLDDFDGKICTVYLTALNAKSSSTACFWRFLPISVVDEGFDPTTVNVAENAVKYFGVTQFLSKYTGNPELALKTTVNNETLGYTNAILSYTSSDPSVIAIENNVMNCLKTGTATITVTAEHNGVTYSEDVIIVVEIAEQGENYATVKEAIAATVGDILTVKGIVGPSLVNRNGFYLFNDDAMIAVIVNDTAILKELEVGNEIILEAKRDLFHNGTGTHAGQIALTEATLVANLYGNHAYSTDFFITDKTLADLKALDVSEQHTTEVYVVKATVEFVDAGYYTKLTISDNGTTFSLYMSGAGQYSWLKAFTGQEVTMEIAPCNWNNKTYYAGCVLAVVNDDGSKIINNLNFE